MEIATSGQAPVTVRSCARRLPSKRFGHDRLWAFIDQGPEGISNPHSVLLRPETRGRTPPPNHITILRAALRRLPGHRPGVRPGRKILIRANSAGATHDLLDWITTQRLAASPVLSPERAARQGERRPAQHLEPPTRATPGTCVISPRHDQRAHGHRAVSITNSHHFVRTLPVRGADIGATKTTFVQT